MVRPSGTLAIGPILRISISLSSGLLGGLAVFLLASASFALGLEVSHWGIEGRFNFESARLLAATGALWGLLFAPVLWGARVNPWMQGLVVAAIPLMVEGLIVLPVVQGAGMFGLQWGLFYVLWVFVAHGVWGTVGGWWNAWTLHQLHTGRDET